MASAHGTVRDADEVRREICARIDQLDRDFRLLSIGELGRRADAIRQLDAHDDAWANLYLAAVGVRLAG